MRTGRRVRDWLRRYEVALYFLTAGLGLYLAAGNVLRAAKWPCEEFWEPWSAAFIALLVSAVYVPAYALYKALDAYFEREERQAAERTSARSQADRDLELLCQQVAAQIAETCPAVQINDLATQIWLCRQNGEFERRYRFFLPHLRKSSGVVWRRGKGVAGLAWARNQDLVSDLTKLQERRKALGPSGFNQLPLDERYGMDDAELASTSAYTGIVASRLFSTDPARRLLAIFVIDYTGRDGFDCVANAARSRQMSTLLGACEQRLTQASSI